MTMLGFDTAMAPTAACVLREDGVAYCTPEPSPERLVGPPDHSAELLPALAGLLGEAGRAWADVRSIAVGTGPGTFTGLRIGIATARALAQALAIPLHPVSSLDALVAGLAERARPGQPVLGLIDARRRQVFATLHRPAVPSLAGARAASRAGAGAARAGEGGDREGGARLPEREWGPLALTRDALLARLAAVTPGPLAGGDWALESRFDLESAGVEVAADSGAHSISALHLCRLAQVAEPVSPQEATPTYVRLPDAEIKRRDAHGRGGGT